MATGELVFAAFEVLLCSSNATIQSLPIPVHPEAASNSSPAVRKLNRDLYFFRFVKEQLQPVDSESRMFSAEGKPQRSTFNSGVVMVEVNGIEPMTSCLQSRRSPN